MLYLQAPAGNNVILKPHTHAPSIEEFFDPFYCQLYGSGTSALAAAILAAIDKKDIQSPEILLPAYACPDLISAILYAKAKPVLCDLEKNSAKLDLNLLESKINKNTAAIIAVNSLGIVENGSKLREITAKYNLLLIEDSAQYLPDKIEYNSWFGDFIILSFGRGKPASILTGGAVLTQNIDYIKLLPTASPTIHSTSRYYFKAYLYNFLINPYIYNLLSKIPGLKLGDTIYKPLSSLSDFNTDIKGLLTCNLERFQTRNLQNINKYNSVLKEYSFIDDLYNRQRHSTNTIPLRYPILVETHELRDKAYSILTKYGVGVSKMYQNTLNRISGVNKFINNDIQYPNATDFSERLLTLPTHNRINQKDIRNLKNSLRKL